MWPFNRQSKSDDKLPKEIKEYYDSEHRERVGVAWLVAFLSLLVTVAIVVGLFFGGRWIYRIVTHKSNTNTTAVQKPVDIPKEPSSNTEDTNKNTANTNTSTSAGDEGSSSANTSTTSATSASSSAPTSGKLTDTGPGDTLSIFIAISILGAVGHNLLVRKKSTS